MCSSDLLSTVPPRFNGTACTPATDSQFTSDFNKKLSFTNHFAGWDVFYNAIATSYLSMSLTNGNTWNFNKPLQYGIMTPNDPNSYKISESYMVVSFNDNGRLSGNETITIKTEFPLEPGNYLFGFYVQYHPNGNLTTNVKNSNSRTTVEKDVIGEIGRAHV